MAVIPSEYSSFKGSKKEDGEAITLIGRSVLIAFLIGWPCDML